MILEIAAHSLRSAIHAQEGGADRIELCTALQTGGLTPDHGLLAEIRAAIDIPMHVLIRPRLGDFVYDKWEIRTMAKSIEQCHKAGAQGVVLGTLDHEGALDVKQICILAEAAEGLDLTFHRAIDVCADPLSLLTQLEQLEFDRVLTSGTKGNALTGANVLREMVSFTESYHLEILAGAGINSSNLNDLIERTGVREYHASAKKAIPLSSADSIGLTYVNGAPIQDKWESDLEEIKALKEIITHHTSE